MANSELELPDWWDVDECLQEVVITDYVTLARSGLVMFPLVITREKRTSFRPLSKTKVNNKSLSHWAIEPRKQYIRLGLLLALIAYRQ